VIDWKSLKETSLNIENFERRQIIDIDFYNQYLCVLYGKNYVVTYNLSTLQPVFKSSYQEATKDISRLFYLPSN
jgi:hypothetical protein